jgi:predicted Zn-dependent peptidase
MELFNCKGFPVVFIPNNSHIVNARVIFNTGSGNEELDSHGIAHFLEHMFFKGTTERNYKEINKVTSKLGSINAYTNREATVYHFTFLSQDLKEAVQTLLEMVFQPAFPEEEFKKEKGVILEECQARLDAPSTYFFTQLSKNLLGTFGHPIIGEREDIEAANLEKLHRFHGRHYNPANAIIAVAGNISVDHLKEILGDLVPGMEPNLSSRECPDFNFDNYDFHHASKQAIICVTNPGVTTRGEIDMDYMPDVFSNALGEGMHSLLFDRLREELGLCYAVGSFHSSNELYGVNEIYCLLDEKNVDLAKEEIFKILEKVKAEGIPEELLDISKRNYLFKFGRGLESSGGIASECDAYFGLEGYPLEQYISFEERRNKVNRITNGSIIEFTHSMFNGRTKISTMTQE